MICYKDATYCGSANCQNACNRQISEADLESARRLGLPIAYALFCTDELIEKPLEA